MKVSTQVARGVVLDELALLAAFGIADLAAIEGTADRTVVYGETSSLGCPIHDVTLQPDGCASCRFLSGEAR